MNGITRAARFVSSADMEEIDAVSWLGGQKMADTVLIIVNQPIVDQQRFRQAWDACDHRAVLDGAANTLYDVDRTLRPDFIIGDLDSITDTTRKFYEGVGVPVIEKPSQYATDFGKAMQESVERWPGTKQFLAFGALGGRVDHSMHSIMCLSRVQQELGVRLLLHSAQNMTFLIAEAARVLTPRDLVKKAVGIAPIMGSAHITTKGLMYDVTDWETSFTTQVSTSNYIVADWVTVETRGPVVFTVEI